MSIKKRKASALLVACGLIAALSCSCTKEHSQKVTDETGLSQNAPSTITDIEPIRSGDIAEAMQWKRAVVLSPWVGEYKEPLLNFLKLIEDKEYDLETVLTSPFNEVPSMGDFHLYLLLGWSGSGLDEMRSATVDSVTIDKKEIRLFLSRPEVQYDGAMMGTDDMRFIGWDINAGQITPGKYTAKLYLKRNLIRIIAHPYARLTESEDNYRIIREMTVNVAGFE